MNRIVLGLALVSLSFLFAPSIGEAQTGPQEGRWVISFGSGSSSLTVSRDGGWVDIRGGGDSYVCAIQSSGVCEGSWVSAAGNHGSFRMTFHSDYGSGYTIVDGYWWYENESYADGRALNGSYGG